MNFVTAAGKMLRRSQHLNMFDKYYSPHCQIEKLEKLTPLEAQLKQIEHLSQSIADGFVYFKKREKEMRHTNGK